MDDDDMDNGNIFRPTIFAGGKEHTESEEPHTQFPSNDYVITDMQGFEWYATGFLIFTSHHVAIMKSTGEGTAIPALIIPIGNVKAAELVEDEDDA
jgi:hypothetical protein